MSTVLDRVPQQGMTALEKRDRLNEVTDRYLAGEMEPEQFVRLRNSLSPDYRSAFKAVARNQRKAQRASEGTFRRFTRHFLRIK